jgi:beta-lactamase regulating signal transducer with metallopeptidase domain
MTSQAFFDLFVRQFVQLSILIVAAGLLSRIFCRRRPHLAYILWILVLIKSVTPPLWSSPIGVFSWDDSHREMAAATGSNTALQPLSENLHIEAFSSVPMFATAQTQIHRWSMVSITLGIWGFGCIAFVFGAALRWLILHRRIEKSSVEPSRELAEMIEGLCQSLGLRRRPRLRLCDAHIGPAVFGIFRPILVLPATILRNKDLDQLRPLLAHEIIHLRRRDPLAAGVQILSQAVWWFHPLVWWTNRNITRFRELCCDAEVIASLQCRPDDYAQTLIDVLRLRRMSGSLSLGIRSAQVTAQRLDHIMTGPVWPHRHTPWRYWLLLTLCGLMLLPGGQVPLHGGDTTTASTDAQNGTNPSTLPSQPQGQVVHFVRLVVDFQTITYQGRQIKLEQLPALLERVPDRGNTVLQVANASDELTMGRFNEVQFRCGQLVTEFGFKYLSYVGKQPPSSIGSPDRIVTPSASVAPTKILPALEPAPVSQLTRIQKFFWTGNEVFHPGDNIVITEVRGTSASFEVGATYQVKGTYTLASRSHATLCLSVTAKNPKDGWGQMGAKQTISITRGSGTFTLTERVPCEGYPHVSFYDETSSFGGVYFSIGPWFSF